MKNFTKMLIPAFVLAAAVGLTTAGCGDDTTSAQADLAASAGADLATPVVHDMASKEHD